MSCISPKSIVQIVEHVLLLNRQRKVAKKIDHNGFRDVSFNGARKSIEKYLQGNTTHINGASIIYSSQTGRVLIFDEKQGIATLFDLSSGGTLSTKGGPTSNFFTLDILREWEHGDDLVHYYAIQCRDGKKVFVWLNEGNLNDP